EAPVTAAAQVPEDNKPPARPKGGWVAVTAGADLPGFAMGSDIKDPKDLARAFSKRIETMRGIRGGDGDKIIVASAQLTDLINSDRHLKLGDDGEGNLERVSEVLNPKAT